METGIFVFPNSSLSQCKFTLARDKRGCGGSLHSKQNKGKQRDTSFPSPEWPVDVFPGKMCRGSERLCGCCQDSGSTSEIFPGAQVWVLSPKSDGASGFGQEGIAHPSPGSKHLPTLVWRWGGRANRWTECAPPLEAPAPLDGILGMSLVQEASGRPLGKGRSPTWSFLGAFAQNSPSISAPWGWSPRGREGTFLFLIWADLVAAKAPNPRGESTQKALPSSKDPFFVSEGGSPSPSGNLPGRRFQLDCRHRVAALSGHTGLLARLACLLGSQVPFLLFPAS